MVRNHPSGGGGGFGQQSSGSRGGNTAVCKYWERNGSCRNGDQCQYSHSGGGGGGGGGSGFQQQPGSRGGGQDAQQCNNWAQTGQCRFGDSCRFSHGSSGGGGGSGFQQQASAGGGGSRGGGQDSQQQCNNWAQTGQCRFGDSCRFSHGSSGGGGGGFSSQSRDNNPQQSGGKPCRDFAANGSCRFGDKCRFSHAPITGTALTPAGGGSWGAAAAVSGFGNTPAPATSGFGTARGFGNQSQGGFGASSTGFGAAPQQSPFTPVPAQQGFGVAQSTGFGQSSGFGGGTGFGQPPPFSGFGQSPSPFQTDNNVDMGGASTGFGGTPSGFGGTPSGFGVSQSGFGGNTFGANTNSGFGQSPFTQQQPQQNLGSLFGQAQATPFGGIQPQQQTPFGAVQPQQQTPFGGFQQQPVAPTGFGQPSPFGVPQSTGFGVPQSTGFGVGVGGFGNMQPQQTAFAQVAAPVVPFGMGFTPQPTAQPVFQAAQPLFHQPQVNAFQTASQVGQNMQSLQNVSASGFSQPIATQPSHFQAVTATVVPTAVPVPTVPGTVVPAMDGVLMAEEVKAFEATHFVLGAIPEIAPPTKYCARQ